MKVFETLQEILLAFIIAILIPVTLYWSINLLYKNPKYDDYVTHNIPEHKDPTAEEQILIKQQVNKFNEAKRPFENTIFFSSIILGIILIIIGTLIKINSLGLGFIAGGILNIIMGLFYKPEIPDSLIFGIYLAILVILIIIPIIRQKILVSIDKKD